MVHGHVCGSSGGSVCDDTILTHGANTATRPPVHYCTLTQNMRLRNIVFLSVIITVTNAQFFNAIRNLFAPVTNLFGGGRFVDDGTRSPQATGKEELFPSDCGRDPNQGTGKLCFPDGLLCRDSKYKHQCLHSYNQN